MSDITIALVAVFASVALISGYAASVALTLRSPARRRLATITMALATPSVGLAATPQLAPSAARARRRTVTPIPKSPREMTRLQRKLASAGYHGTRAIAIYSFAELALAIVGFLVPTLLFGMRGAIFGALGAFVGYSAPAAYVQRAIRRRRKQIQNGLPDVLDLLIVCLEAGLGLDQAILKSAEELEIAYPALAAELRMVNIETRAGKPRLESLKNFSRRTQVDDVRALVAMLVQTDRFGTSVAQALRTHADVSRVKRRQRAEERAAKLGVKLVFPLVFCLLPAFFVVSIGPAIIKLSEFFDNNSSTLGGTP